MSERSYRHDELESEITALFAAGAAADREQARDVFARLRAALSAGEVRAAEPDASAPSGWRVNAWVKQGILLGFRFGAGRRRVGRSRALAVLRQGHAAAEAARRGARACASCRADRPCATARISAAASSACRRCTSTSARTSATSTLVDSHALVGSCAQVGARVHVSAAAQIGGVLEPVGALPVVIEDDVLVGGNCGVYEGAIVKRRAVLASGTILTGSTPIYDLPNGRIIEPSGGPLVVPEGAVVVPGTRPVTSGRRPRVGPRRSPRRSSSSTATSARTRAPRWSSGSGRASKPNRQFPERTRLPNCWGLKVATSSTPAETEPGPLESWKLAVLEVDAPPGAFNDKIMTLAFDPIAFARALINIDSTTGQEAEAGVVARARAAGARLHRRRAAARSRVRQRHRDARSARGRVLDALRLRAAVLSEPRRRRAALRARRVRCEGHPGGAGRGRRAAARRGASGASACCSSSARSAAATARSRRTRCAPGSRFLINGEPTDNRLATATRGVLRLRLRARGTRGALGDARARRVGDRQADRRARARCGRFRCRPIRSWARRSTAWG